MLQQNLNGILDGTKRIIVTKPFYELAALVDEELREVPFNTGRLLLRHISVQWMSIGAIDIDLFVE